MAGRTQWFVRKGEKTHGPFTSPQLKQLAEASKISATTRIRRGKDGQWVAAQKVKGLFAHPAVKEAPRPMDPPPNREPIKKQSQTGPPSLASRPAHVAEADSDVPQHQGSTQDWYFAKEGTEYGPVSFALLLKMTTEGKLQVTDLVWHEGMTGRARAEAIEGLFPGRRAPSGPIACQFCGGEVAANAVKCRHCNEFLDGRQQGPGAQPQMQVTVNASQPAALMQPPPQKSVAVALLLTFFFGPLGMLYSTVVGGLVMLGVWSVVSFISVITLGFGLILIPFAFIAQMVWAALACER